MLTLRYHGGHCCGIMHIHNLHAPDSIQNAISDTFSKPSFPTVSGGTICSNMNAPPETTLDRLDRYLEYRDRATLYNVTEVVINDAQFRQWNDLLIERGFEQVAECHNSNSGNEIYIYLRVKNTDSDSIAKFKKIKDALAEKKKERDKERNKKANARSEAAKKGWDTRRANQAPEEVVVPLAPPVPAVKCNSCEYGVEPSRVAKGYKRCASCRRKAVNSKKEK